MENTDCLNSENCLHCCHCLSVEHSLKFFPKDADIARCELMPSQYLDLKKIKKTGCDFCNKDVSTEKICFNCKNFLGGSDWGLACGKHYNRLPTALTRGCEDFDKI